MGANGQRKEGEKLQGKPNNVKEVEVHQQPTHETGNPQQAQNGTHRFRKLHAQDWEERDTTMYLRSRQRRRPTYPDTMPEPSERMKRPTPKVQTRQSQLDMATLRRTGSGSGVGDLERVC